MLDLAQAKRQARNRGRWMCAVRRVPRPPAAPVVLGLMHLHAARVRAFRLVFNASRSRASTRLANVFNAG
eukprot:14680235-Alexandrium_andersonii.AAC.1